MGDELRNDLMREVKGQFVKMSKTILGVYDSSHQVALWTTPPWKHLGSLVEVGFSEMNGAFQSFSETRCN